MGPTMKDLGIDKLAPEQRVALAREIWDSLDAAGAAGDLTPEQWAEIARRDAEMDANPDSGETWDDVKAYLDAHR